MKLASLILAPAQIAASTASTALTVVGATVGATRQALGAAADSSLGAVALANPNTGPLLMLQQASELLGEDRALGYALRQDGPLDRLLAPGGVIDRLTAPDGALERLMAKDGAVERLLEPGGVIDRLFVEGGPVDRLAGEGGLIDRAMAPDGPLDRITEKDGPVDRLTAPGGVLDQALSEGGLIETMLASDGAIQRLTAPGGPLDQLVTLAETLSSVAPNLQRMSVSVDLLQETAEILAAAVGPLGELVGRLPTRWLKSAMPAIGAAPGATARKRTGGPTPAVTPSTSASGS